MSRKTNSSTTTSQHDHHKLCCLSQHPPGATVNSKVAGIRGGWKQIEVEASVLPEVMPDLPSIPVSPVTQWKHLLGLELVDPDYGTPDRVGMFLGGEVFIKAVLHGWRYGANGVPSAFNLEPALGGYSRVKQRARLCRAQTTFAVSPLMMTL